MDLRYGVSRRDLGYGESNQTKDAQSGVGKIKKDRFFYHPRLFGVIGEVETVMPGFMTTLHKSSSGLVGGRGGSERREVLAIHLKQRRGIVR